MAGSSCGSSPSATKEVSNVNPNCGLTIKAEIGAQPKNDLLARTISYGFINQAQTFAALETQRAANDVGKQAEANAAARNGPKL
jgi:hypothetical protein